ncbi:MAG: hypothetical protein LBQ64_06025 [Bacteroidales bacterium]|jgi:hypothetical protein|nr:hypothetical protein [Bacteroidales bacterium]
MLSRRKKKNLLAFGMGMLSGAVITMLIAYFGIIANFTKDKIVKISEVFPDMDDTADMLVSLPEPSAEKRIVAGKTLEQDTLKDTTIISEDSIVSPVVVTALEEVSEIAIKTDVKIAEVVIPIEAVSKKDTLTGVKPTPVQKGEMSVEQWENPTNFAGYRKSQNKLIVYGIDINAITLQLIDDSLYLIYQDKKLLLKDTDDFLHYPPGFIK